MSDRDELRQAVAKAIRLAFVENKDITDAAIAAYEAHRPRPAVVLTQEEWNEAIERSVQTLDESHSGVLLREIDEVCDIDDVDATIRAAFPWLRVEGE